MAAGDEFGAEPPASAWRLLRDRTFARYFLGSLTSNIGTWFQDIAAAIVVFQLTGSAAMVAGVAVAGYATSLLLAPLGGQLADRFDRRLLLLVTNLGQALAAGLLAVLVALDQADAWTIFLVSAVIGIGRAINTPTLHAMLPSLVEPKDLAPAAALQAVTFHFARAVGPLFGALVVTQFGGAAAFGVNAATFVVFAVLLATIRVRRAQVRGAPGGGGAFAGVGYVRRRPVLAMLLVTATVAGMATDPVLTLGPSFADVYGQPAEYAGWLVSAFGAGSIVAAPLVGRIRTAAGPVRTSVLGLAGAGAGLLVVATVPSHIAALIGAALAGFSFLTAGTDINTTLQELLEDHVRGRVMALWTMGFLGSRPVAALLDGWLADAVSPWAAVAAVAAILLLAAAGAAWWFRSLGGPRALRSA